jgi:uncharacterized membrane protein YhaH (DUF805 family)
MARHVRRMHALSNSIAIILVLLIHLMLSLVTSIRFNNFIRILIELKHFRIQYCVITSLGV